MRGWGQYVVIFMFVVLPLISKMLAAFRDKQVADREQKRRESAANVLDTGSPVNERGSETGGARAAPDMRLPGTAGAGSGGGSASDRRAELQRRREAQLAEWRARQARSEAAAEDALGANAGGVQTGLGSGAVAASGKAGVTGDLFAAQSGGQLISSMIERVEQQARQQQQRRQPQGRQAQAPQRGNRTTLAEHQRRQHQAGSEGESKVHRLVLSDEELAAKRGMPVKKKPMTSAAAANSPQINAAAVFRATRSREALRQAFILKEVFDPPVGLRDV